MVTKEDLLAPVFNILSVGREERAVIDMFLARDADIFIGHFSSTFSTVRAQTHKRAPRAATIYRRAAALAHWLSWLCSPHHHTPSLRS